MAWNIEFEPKADRDLDKLDPQMARRILSFLFDRLAVHDDPRTLGEPLYGKQLGAFWRYRVGDYRLMRVLKMKRWW